MTSARKKVRIVSTGTNQKGKATGTFYVIQVNKLAQEKLEIKKFDRFAFNQETGKRGMHVIFKEKKLK
jgi:large subunit ribosomal protein L33